MSLFSLQSKAKHRATREEILRHKRITRRPAPVTQVATTPTVTAEHHTSAKEIASQAMALFQRGGYAPGSEIIVSHPHSFNDASPLRAAIDRLIHQPSDYPFDITNIDGHRFHFRVVA